MKTNKRERKKKENYFLLPIVKKIIKNTHTQHGRELRKRRKKCSRDSSFKYETKYMRKREFIKVFIQ